MTSDSDEKTQTRKPHSGTWLVVGAAAGVAFGAAFHQLALGIALGAAFGAAIDIVSHVKYKNRQ